MGKYSRSCTISKLSGKRLFNPTRLWKCAYAVALGTLLGLPSAHATVIDFVIDFEGLLDGYSVLTQYPGVTFQNTLALTAGLSLNESEFPPMSGVNAVIDDGGQILINFLTPVTSVGGFYSIESMARISGVHVGLLQVLRIETTEQH